MSQAENPEKLSRYPKPANPHGLTRLQLRELTKVYFIGANSEPTLLTSAQMYILSKMSEEYKEDLEKLNKSIDANTLSFFLKVVAVEKYAQTDTATKLGLAKSTVNTQLSRAKKKLGIASNLHLLMIYSLTMKEHLERITK